MSRALSYVVGVLVVMAGADMIATGVQTIRSARDILKKETVTQEGNPDHATPVRS